MPSDLDVALERVRQSIGAPRRDIYESAGAIAGARAGAGGALRVGDRVYDTVSGLEGEVIDGTRQNVVLPATK